MKQILQSLKDGTTTITEVPTPKVSAGSILIETHRSLVSAGTERMLVDFGRASLLDKARQQPEKVRMVIEKARVDGIGPTIEAVRSKLDQPVELGYCCAGRVLEVGQGVCGFEPGDRVASNGKHAEIVNVPKHLCAKIPDGVSDDAATFTVLAAIGLQGIRLVKPTIGECVVVTGLGLIGLLTVQLLHAHGCRVLGIDVDPERLQLAEAFGATCVNSLSEDPVVAAMSFSRGRGVDAVLITASTSSSEPVHQAALMSRKRGRIVLVGVAGLELSRADFYEKELTFQVSCSYGPGRYDPAYEEAGQDYPIGFVRWTEQRNLEAVLDLMANGQLDVAPLVSHRFTLPHAEQAYALLASQQPSLGIMLEYPVSERAVVDSRSRMVRTVALAAPESAANGTSVAFLGAGNYAGRVLMSAFKSAGARLHTVVSSGGVSATHFGQKYGFASASTDADEMLADPAVDTIVVATRHDMHAHQVLSALESGKHVFCEKPLCLTLDELAAIEVATARWPDRWLMVGFNRRFAPQVLKMKSLLRKVAGPKSFVLTVNAGEIPSEHWTQDPQIGGGRILGEACHFIDLLRFLAGAPITAHQRTDMDAPTEDTVTLQFEFADGSIGTVHYFSNGSKAFPKERVEVFAAGRVLQLDNFRRLRGFGWPGFRKSTRWRQDKGQKACASAFVRALCTEGAAVPIPLADILEVSRISIEVSRRC